MTEEFDGHVQNDPVFREMADVYSTIGGELPVRIFSSISDGMNMNELAERLIDFEDREWHTEGHMDMFEAQVRDMIDEFEEKKLIQEQNGDWALTSYGQSWRTQMDSANQTLLSLVNNDHIAASRFEAENRQLIYNGIETMGDVYNALGFNVGVEPYPETLPVLHILGEDLNDGEIPRDYIDGVEQLEIMGMLEDAEYDGKGALTPEMTEVGQRIYDEVVLDDREFVKEHYGLN